MVVPITRLPDGCTPLAASYERPDSPRGSMRRIGAEIAEDGDSAVLDLASPAFFLGRRVQRRSA